MPAHTPDNDPFVDWLREHGTGLASLDPHASLDDLDPLRDVVGDARVVAVGENSHFIREFSLARHRILRYLVERCGFSAYAFEFGFSEGFSIDAWVQGAGDEGDLDRLCDAAIPWGVRETLRWMREHNRAAPRPVRFVGIDVPEAGGSLLPALAPLADYLGQVDPDALPLLQAAIRIAERFARRSMVLAAPVWARLGVAEQDALTAALTRLRIRFRAVEPLYVARSDQHSYDRALWRLEGACHTDYHFRAMGDIYAGRGAPGDASAREIYMAGSVRWHLEHSGPGARVVLAAHNAHIQKTPVAYDGHLSALPMGQHLHRMLGDGYVAIGLTSTAGHTAAMHLDETAPFGFRVENLALEAPEPGSLEAAFVEAGLGLSLADLRRAPRPAADRPGIAGIPDRLRMHGSYLHTPVLDAFDGVINVPTSTVAEDIGF